MTTMQPDAATDPAMPATQDRRGTSRTRSSVCLGAHLFVGVLITTLVLGCSGSTPQTGQNSVARALYGAEPLQLKGDALTVENQSGRDWTDVQITLNTYYRISASSIAAGGHAQARLDSFVDAYNRHFDPGHTSMRSFRVTAKLPDGQTFELQKRLQ
jgi:hypothetical protein